MAYGLRVKNAATGSIQIDQGYFNLAFIEKANLISGDGTSAPVGTAGALVSTGTYTCVSDDMPLIAFRSAYMMAPFTAFRSGNNWTFRFIFLGLQRPFTVYRFGKPPVLGPGYGIRAKTNGQVTFDSRHKYLRRAARIGPGTGTTPSGLTYAAMASGMGATIDRVMIPDGSRWIRQETRRWGSVLFNADGSWDYSSFQYYNVRQSEPSYMGGNIKSNTLGALISMIDVTGY